MRLKRPSPAMVVAIAALVLAAGGFAFAAIPAADGSIHGCYRKDGGALRVVKGAGGCKAGERALAWNRGVAAVTVRTKTLVIPVTCSGENSFRVCSGSGTDTVRCRAGERATGGGFGQDPSPGTSVQQSKPAPTAGEPTGWTVAALAFSTGATADASAARVPIYAVCAN
ncbi:MAG: hypothetical protein ACJ760_02090 [Thermoleophilaceae bacterium]